MDVTKEYAPCPTCGQYSHSISGGFVEEASLHFNAMFSHRGDGLPTQHCFDERTRDMAQRLLAALTTAQSEAAELRKMVLQQGENAATAAKEYAANMAVLRKEVELRGELLRECLRWLPQNAGHQSGSTTDLLCDRISDALTSGPTT